MTSLYPHQEEVVGKLHNGAIVWGDVGTGKSMVAVHYYQRKEAPKRVYVITTAKKRDSLDWDREFARIGVGRFHEGNPAGVLLVDSWNNLHKYRDVEGSFFIFDEQRVVGSGKWTKDFIRIAHANQWILLSATPGDTWLDYIPIFIAQGHYRTRTEFLREHVIFSRFSKFPKVERYVNVNKLVRLRNKTLVHMPYERHTERHTEVVTVDFDRNLFEKVLKRRWHVYKDRPLRDVAELFMVMRKVVNSSSSRVEELRRISAKHPRLIVFYNFDYELEALRSLFAGISEQTLSLVDTTSSSPLSRSETMDPTSPACASAVTRSLTPVSSKASSTTTTSNTASGFEIAEWNGHKHQPIPTTDRWVYLVQYQAGSEGWNCIDTDSMLFFSLTYSYKNFHQAFGRIDRLNTPFKKLNYYILMSESVIDKAIWKALQEKRNFNESKFLESRHTLAA